MMIVSWNKDWKDIIVVIADLNVMFGQSEYVFYENVSMGSVVVKIDKEILQDFTIQVTGGKLNVILVTFDYILLKDLVLNL